jgi:hypothetical protein
LHYICKAVCRYGNSPLSIASLHKTIEINGIGKYPHFLIESDNLIASEMTLNFGEIFLGQSYTKYITLINMTDVIIYFMIF